MHTPTYLNIDAQESSLMQSEKGKKQFFPYNFYKRRN